MNKYKHVGASTFAQIKDAAAVVGALEKGCRNEVQRREAFVLLELKHTNNFRACGSLPEHYSIITEYKENIGTKNYAYIIEAHKETTVSIGDDVRETEKSIIITPKYGTKKIINKSNILCFVW